MNPNHFLAVCIDYLYRHRQGWAGHVAVGKTLVSSAMIDKVVADLGRELCEVPVGFKWFVDGLYSGRFGFGGEESAGLLSCVKTVRLGLPTKMDHFVLTGSGNYRCDRQKSATVL